MNIYNMMLPSKYEIPDGADIFSVVPVDEFPTLHASIDGKPSEQFETGRSYVTASLLSADLKSFDYVHKRLTELYGAPLSKPANMRKKRRLQYLREMVNLLIAMKFEPNGLPINSVYSVANSDALDPRHALEYFRAHPVERANNGIHEITDTHVIFRDGTREERLTHAQFGGMAYWVYMAIQIDKHFTKESGQPRIWVLHADKLPFDSDGMRMKILGRLLEEALDSRVWLWFTRLDCQTEDIPVDMITDIFVNIAYESLSPDGSQDRELAEAFSRFRALESKSA